MARRSTPTPPPVPRGSRPSLKTGGARGARASIPEGPSSRRTLEVDPGWLEAPASPPPLEGAAADRDTLEVKLEWLEEEARASERSPASRRAGPTSARRAQATTPTATATPKRKKGMRPSVDPAWLASPPPEPVAPPPPSERGRRALPPPLPPTTTSPEKEPSPPSRRGARKR